MANNIKVFRLLGEDMMAELVLEDTTSYIVKNAVRIVVMPNKADPNNPNMALAPFMQFSDDKELTINKSHVITTGSPLTDFINQYNSIFGGIHLATSKIITP
jgi:hypothetical protein